MLLDLMIGVMVCGFDGLRGVLFQLLAVFTRPIQQDVVVVEEDRVRSPDRESLKNMIVDRSTPPVG